MTSRRFHAVAAVCTLIVACGGDDASSPADTTGGDDDGGDVSTSTPSGQDESSSSDTGDAHVCETLTFDNEVDEAACPYLQGKGLEPTPASETELCRRYFVDLVGRVPTADEVASTCSGRAPADIVDELMDGDAYVQLVRRKWADELRMSSLISYYKYLEDLDGLVQQLARGEILLPEFAIQASTHPGYVGRFTGQDLVGYNFQMFLGRDAEPHERLALLGMWRSWTYDYKTDPDYYFDYSPVIVDTILCAYLPALCQSDLWGHTSVIIPMPFPDSEDYTDNLLQLEELGDDDWAELRKPGVLITQQPTFYETAADKALRGYLGYKAGVQMPLVQQTLVAMLQDNGGDVRAAEREILTSVLYTMAAAADDPDGTMADDGTPDEWHGPMKQMTAEAWLDSIAVLTDISFGSCDPRYPEVAVGEPFDNAPEELYRWHPNEYPKDPYYPAESNAPDYTYRDIAQRLGGCPDQLQETRFTGTGVMISLAHAQILQAVCEYMPASAPLVPPGLSLSSSDPDTLTSIATHMIDTITLGDTPPELDDAIAAAVDGCLDDDDCDAQLFAQQSCQMLLQSGAFLFY